MKKLKRTYKIYYWVEFDDKWWCQKCKKFVDYNECLGVHTRSSSVTIKTMKKLKKLINKLFLEKTGHIEVSRFLKYKPGAGHIVEDWEYKW